MLGLIVTGHGNFASGFTIFIKIDCWGQRKYVLC